MTVRSTSVDDREVEGSAGWWLHRLSYQLEARRPGLQLLWDWFEGDPPPPVGADAAREAWRALQSQSRTNLAELIVEGVRDRLKVVGFKTGAGDDRDGDAAARRIFLANDLDAQQSVLHRMVLAMGEAFTIVGPPDPVTGEPVITVEDPRQCVGYWSPTSTRRLEVVLKTWVDETRGVEEARLIMREEGGARVWAARRQASRLLGASGVVVPTGGRVWLWDGEDLGSGTKIDVEMPVTRFVNLPDAFGRGRGEFERHLAPLTRINTMILQRVVIAIMQAFRQRALTKEEGVELPTHDAEGVEIDYERVFSADPAAWWDLPAGIGIWESQQVDLQPLLAADKTDLMHLAAATRTPIHYLSPESGNQTAEGAVLSREGLHAKVDDRKLTLGPSWAATLAAAFGWKGDAERAGLVDLQTLWMPTAQHSLQARADAAAKALAAGLPWRNVMLDIWGYSPEEVHAMQADREQEQLLAALTATPVPSSGPAQEQATTVSVPDGQGPAGG